MMVFLRELLFRLRLYLNGIRFYDSARLDKAVLVKELNVRLFGWTESTISLYRLECIDFVLRKGTLTPDAYVSYLAKIKTHAGATDHEVSLLDGKLFFINGRFNRLKDEEREPEVIAEVLIDVLKGYLKNR
jgi:hypothetical protein